MGQRLRDAGVPVTEVRSSRWCRALDTARLAFPNVPVAPEAALDSFFGAQESAARQTEQTRSLIAGWRDRQGVLALVTHQVNVTALTQVFPAEGEIVVLRPNLSGFELVGRVPP
jgi:broad specificity phosphatase PhoE